MVTQPRAGLPEAPREWIDKDTGHRVIRLSDKPGSGSLYFNYNGYTLDGRFLAISTPDGISTVDLKSHALTPLVVGKVRLLFVGRKTGQVYYQRMAEDGTAAVEAADPPPARSVRSPSWPRASASRRSTPTRPCWPAWPRAPTCRSRPT